MELLKIDLSALIHQFGLGLFIWYLINGLKDQIGSLQGVVAAQKETIEVMDRRIQETEKIGGIYKSLLSDLPEDLERYKKIIATTKDEVILQLQSRQAETEREVDEAKRQLKVSGRSEVDIATYARIAQKLASKRKNKYGHESELDLKAISLFDGRDIGNSVILLKSTKSLQAYLTSLKFELEIRKDASLLKSIIKDGRMPDTLGSPVRQAVFSETSRDDDWLMVANNQIWLGSARLERLNDEFAYLQENAMDSADA